MSERESLLLDGPRCQECGSERGWYGPCPTCGADAPNALPCGHPKSDETSADGYTFCAVCAVQPKSNPRHTFTPEQVARAHELGKERRAERVRLWLQVSEAPAEIVSEFEKLAKGATPEVPISLHEGRIRRVLGGPYKGAWIAYCTACDWHVGPRPIDHTLGEEISRHEQRFQNIDGIYLPNTV